MISRLRITALQILVLIMVVGAGWGIARAVDPRVTAADIQGMREAAAVQAGRAFLDEYVESDGRVVRRDEGGDVVSEGQAYGMLIAVAVDDEDRFRAIWDWEMASRRTTSRGRCSSCSQTFRISGTSTRESTGTSWAALAS